jgi:hypothetical protein
MRWQVGWSLRSKTSERLRLTRTADVARPLRAQGLTSLKRKSFAKLGSHAVPMAVERVLSAIRRRISCNSSGIGSAAVSANHALTSGARASMIGCRPEGTK